MAPLIADRRAKMDLRPIAQVVAVEPAGPDGHGVNWLAGMRPKPGDLLYRAADLEKVSAAQRELRSKVTAYEVHCAAVEAEVESLRGERGVLVRLLVEADKVLSTLEGESTDEQEMLEGLRRQILAATAQHRPQESDLLSVRAGLGA